jgi:hypothetical protein
MGAADELKLLASNLHSPAAPLGRIRGLQPGLSFEHGPVLYFWGEMLNIMVPVVFKKLLGSVMGIRE